MQQTDGIGGCVVGTERVGADELGQLLCLVRFGAAHRTHFMQDDGNTGLGNLPGGFGSGETAADNVNWFVCHTHGNRRKRRQMQRKAPGDETSIVGPCSRPGGESGAGGSAKKTTLAGGGGSSECRLGRPTWEEEMVGRVRRIWEEEKSDEALNS